MKKKKLKKELIAAINIQIRLNEIIKELSDKNKQLIDLLKAKDERIQGLCEVIDSYIKKYRILSEEWDTGKILIKKLKKHDHTDKL